MYSRGRHFVVLAYKVVHASALDWFLDCLDHSTVENLVDRRLIDVGSDSSDCNSHLSSHLLRFLGILARVVGARNCSFLPQDVHNLVCRVKTIENRHH
jgi:hypothetical protein